eukprot:c21385_g1_i2 orf=376-2949(+)
MSSTLFGAMESELPYQHSSRGFSYQGVIDDATKENMLTLRLQSWNQVVDYNSFMPVVTMCSRPNLFESSQGKNQVRIDSYPLQNSAAGPREDLTLTLGFGCTPKPFATGASSLTSEALTQDWHECIDDEVDLGLGLTTHRRTESKVMALPNAPVSKGACFAGVCLDLESAEGWQDTCLETRAQGNSSFQEEVKFSNNSNEIDLQLGLSGNCLSLESDCLSDLPRDTLDIRVDAPTSGHIPVVDEGSTSARFVKSGGYMASLLQNRLAKGGPSNAQRQAFIMSVDAGDSDGVVRQGITKVSVDAGESDGVMQEGTSTSLACGGDKLMRFHGQMAQTFSTSSPAAEQRSAKMCKFKGCCKGARGASGLCIAHGGGRRCQRLNCKKGAEGRTMFCKAHGGGRRCQSLGCIKSAEGRTDFCIAHGGGRRCTYEGCSKAARGRSGLCIRHGGGKRCQKEGCTKSAEGFSGMCISHGGGRRCQYPGCGKGAQGSTKFCKGHGGGRRCEFEGCSKGAEGSTPFCKGHGGGKRCTFAGGLCTKSVHGGTAFCVAHGGGKRCSVEGCTKSARGRTDFCVRHGGGKRCKFDDCNKSAQGSTDYCKAHGGGKRCLWGQEGSVYDGSMLEEATLHSLKASCDKFARGKTGLCSAHTTLLEQFDPFGHTVSSTSSPQGSLSDQLYTNPHLQQQSDLTEHTLQRENDHSFNVGSQGASNVEGSWRPHYPMSSTLVFKAQAASRRCIATDVTWQNTTDGFPSRLLSHSEYSACQLPVQDPSICNRAACNALHSGYAGTGERMPESSEACFPHIWKDLVAPSSRVLLESVSRAHQNAALYDVTNDPEGRVHGGGRCMALLAREGSSHDQVGHF